MLNKIKERVIEWFFAIWPLALVLAIFCLAILMSGCKSSKEIPVVHDTIINTNTEYVNRYLHDSIVKYDSIYIREKGDTIFIDKIHYRYVTKLSTDTLVKSDTLIKYTEVPVEVTKVVKKVSWLWTLIISGAVLALIWCIKSGFFVQILDKIKSIFHVRN